MYKIENLTEEDIKVIGNALIQLPYGAVAELINKINAQLDEQSKQDLKG